MQIHFEAVYLYLGKSLEWAPNTYIKQIPMFILKKIMKWPLTKIQIFHMELLGLMYLLVL